MGGHHMSFGNPMALGQLGHPVAAMGQQMSQTTAYPSLLPQFQQFPQHQVVLMLTSVWMYRLNSGTHPLILRWRLDSWQCNQGFLSDRIR